MYLRKDLNFEDLLKYNFKRVIDGSAYEYRGEDYTLFIWRSLKDKTFEYKRVYIEVDDFVKIITPDIIMKLIKDDIIC